MASPLRPPLPPPQQEAKQEERKKENGKKSLIKWAPFRPWLVFKKSGPMNNIINDDDGNSSSNDDNAGSNETINDDDGNNLDPAPRQSERAPPSVRGGAGRGAQVLESGLGLR